MSECASDCNKVLNQPVPQADFCDTSVFDAMTSPNARKYYRDVRHRIFVNRSLHLDKIKFFGFDMDYTLAEYVAPEFEELAFKMAIERLIKQGYPKEFSEFEYDPDFAIRGLWFDKIHGNLLKVDPYGNILICVHGFKFLKTSEIYDVYPNKFVILDDTIHVLNTLFDLPETYLLACVVDYFTNKFSESAEGVQNPNNKSANSFMPYKSIYQDVRKSFDIIHDVGTLKTQVVAEISKYIKQQMDLPRLFDIMRKHGKKIFLLTNSDYNYSNRVMEYLFAVPTAEGRPWQDFFDFIVVDACKPLFFAEGTLLRQLDTKTGAIRIGLETDASSAGNIYSGGNSEVFTKLINAKGRDVLYCGDHVYGDILKSKKIRGWRTFLLVPELEKELHVWTSERALFDQLTALDVSLANTYKNMDSFSNERPDLSGLKKAIRETIHKLDMSYGKLGSMFRCGSRQTHFAYQLTQYADLYATSIVNLIHYPLTYLFRAPPTLMPHESTVVPASFSLTDSVSALKMSPLEQNGKPVTPEVLASPRHSESVVNKVVTNNGKTTGNSNPKLSTRSNSSLPHPSPAVPTEVTHHHDTDEEDSSDSDLNTCSKNAQTQTEEKEKDK